MFAPLAMGAEFGSSDWLSGRRGPMLRRKKPRTSRMPPRKKRWKIGHALRIGLVMRPSSVLSLSTKPEPGWPVPPPSG